MRSKNAELTKQTLARMAKTSRVIALAFRLAFAVVCCCLVFAVGLFCYNVALGQAGDGVVDAALGIATNVLVFAVLGLTALVIANVFASIAEGGSPFTEAQVKRLRVIGALLAAEAVLSVVTSALHPVMLQSDVLVMGVGSMKTAAAPLPLVEVNASFVIGSVLAFCLAYLFKYGALLQRLSDDTV